MAADGLFTYEDLYADKSTNYHHRPVYQVPSSLTSHPVLSVLNIPITTTIVPTSYFAKLVSPTEIESGTKLNRLADVIPFTYFYWILVALAILLTLTLIIVFIYYFRTFIKNYRTRRGSLTSFYRHRTVNRRVHAPNIYQRTATAVSTAPAPAPPPRTLLTPPCPSQSLKCIDDQLYRQNSDVTNSPQIARHDIYLKEPLSTFTSSTSNVSSALYSRLSARSSDPPLKVEQLYESQRASMTLDDEPENDSLIVDNN